MTSRAAVRPYATALFDVLGPGPAGASAEAALRTLNDAIGASPQLREAFESSAFPADKKRAVLDGVIALAGEMPAELKRLLHLLADHGRLALLPELAKAYDARLREARKVVDAEVVTALPLSDDRRAALAAALSQATGGRVTLKESIDPAIIGGVVARVGSTVYDGSVTRQLERLRQKLLAEV